MTLVENTGLNGLIYIDTSGTYGASPTWSRVAGQRKGTLNRGSNVVDARSKDAYGWPRTLLTNNTYTLDFDGVFMTDDVVGTFDPSLISLQTCWHDRSRLYFKVAFPIPNTTLGAQSKTANTYIFPASVSKFNVDMPYDNVYTYNGTLEGYGEPTFAAAA